MTTPAEAVRFTEEELEWIFIYFNKSLGLSYRGDDIVSKLKLEELTDDQFTVGLPVDDLRTTQRIISKTRLFGPKKFGIEKG